MVFRILWNTKAHDTLTRNSWELTRARNLYVCHSDLQQDISRASFSHQIECVLFHASFSCEFLVRLSWALQPHVSCCAEYERTVDKQIYAYGIQHRVFF